MDSSPRRWVLKPMFPQLQPSDLRSITDPAPDLDHLHPPEQSYECQDLLVSVQQVSVFQDGNSSSDEWQPSSPSSSSGSHCGFYSFVEDPKSPEAEQNEVWKVSPQRQAQLATLKEERRFKLQTYSSSNQPESLFAKGNGDSQYKVDSNSSVHLMNNDEEKQFRKEIIRNQAPKRNQLDPQKPAESLAPPTTNRLIESLCLTFSPIRPRPGPSHPSEPGTVDKEQINFGAAREKFVKMEQDQLASLLGSSRTHLNSLLQPDPDLYISRKVEITTEVSDDPRLFNAEPKDQSSQKKVMVSKENLNRKNNVFEDLDPGLHEHSVGVAGWSTIDDDQFIIEVKTSRSTALHETPIEREIRLVQEREEDLRISRGLKNNKDQRQMVLINTTCSQLPQTPVMIQGKSQVSIFSQSKVQNGDQSRQQEAILEQNCRVPPLEPENIRKFSDQEDEVSGTDEVFQSPCCPHRHPEEAWTYQTNPAIYSFTRMDQETLFHQDQTASSERGGSPGSLEPADLQKTLSVSWKETLESTRLPSRGQGAPNFIEKEIEEALRREQELKDFRESMKGTSQQLFTPDPLVDQASSVAIRQFYPPLEPEKPISSSSHRLGVRLPSVSFITAKPWASPSSAASSPAQVMTVTGGLTEAVLQDADECRAKLKLDENSYAGIQVVDDINNQVIESTRVIRHKSKRALLWEAGLFANQEKL